MKIYESKKEYENMPVPDRLESIVENAVSKAEYMEFKGISGKVKFFRAASVISAVALVVLMIMLNTNKNFALAARKVPVLGQFVSVLTIADYEEDDDRIINVRLPQIKNSSADDLENRINNEIRVKINSVIKEAEARAAEYRQAFMATGGTEEEWHPMEIYVDYQVKCNTDNILSFVIGKSESYASVYEERYYYNIDMETGRDIRLSDVLGPDYVNIANTVIKKEIERRISEEDVIFFGYGNDENMISEKFETVDESTKFYINEDRQVVIVFDKYDIAPGYMGFVEFVIASFDETY